MEGSRDLNQTTKLFARARFPKRVVRIFQVLLLPIIYYATQPNKTLRVVHKAQAFH